MQSLKTQKKFKKALDNLIKVCYNKYVNKNKSLIKKGIDTMEKMTNVKAINYVLGNCDVPADVKEKLEKMRDQFVKKNGAERKPTANQTENAGLKVAIVAGMEVGKKYTITDLMKAIPQLADLSNQRVSALVRQLIEEGKVERTEEKRKAYFEVIAETSEEDAEVEGE